MRIVYIEDNAANVALVERICHLSKDEIVTFTNADEALSELEPESADLILMDLHLGNRSINGLELTRLLRQKGITVPIIAITAYDSMGYADQYEAAGCDKYLRKPVSIPHIVNLLNEYRL
jgi:CheY-like chemotaxis protein